MHKKSMQKKSIQKKNLRTNLVNLGKLSNLLGFHLRIAQLVVFKNFEETIDASRISPGVFGILEIIGKNPGLVQSRLAEALHLDRSSLVPVLNKLQNRALVMRHPNEHDRRCNGLWLTKKGEHLRIEAGKLVDEHEAQITEYLGASERTDLIQLLQKINEIEDKSEDKNEDASEYKIEFRIE